MNKQVIAVLIMRYRNVVLINTWAKRNNIITYVGERFTEEMEYPLLKAKTSPNLILNVLQTPPIQDNLEM